jgi:ABC-type transporter Mla subunit MlaD
MHRLFAVLALTVFAVSGCAGTNDAADIATSSTTSEAGEVAASVTSFCDATSQINDAFDTLARTMLALNIGEESDEFAAALNQTVALLEANVERAPSELVASSQLLADAYTGFSELVVEFEYDLGTLPTNDPRATALTSDQFRAAITSIGEHCEGQS